MLDTESIVESLLLENIVFFCSEELIFWVKTKNLYILKTFIFDR